MTLDKNKCHCGRELHYGSVHTREAIDEIVRQKGRYVRVPYEDHAYLVDRHFIALHGIKAAELPLYGFEKVS